MIVRGKKQCQKCKAMGHNRRTCGVPPRPRKPPKPRKPRKPARYKSPGLLLLSQAVIQAVSVLPNEAAIQAMIDRHNAAKVAAVAS